jgi:hypothetical protein
MAELMLEPMIISYSCRRNKATQGELHFIVTM